MTNDRNVSVGIPEGGMFMKTYKYNVFAEYCKSKYCKNCVVYGIDVKVNSVLTASVHFVTKDFEKIKALTEKLNQCQASPIHLNEIIEDEIGDIYHAHYFG